MDYFINANKELSNPVDNTNQNVNSNESILCPEQTYDESMAVEALRQLGGMYQNVVTTEQSLPLLACSICDLQFQTTADLRAHTETCSNYPIDGKCRITKLPCKYCYTYFDTRPDLEKHIQENHNTSRPYICHYCNMKFVRSSSLSNHLKIHNYVAGRDSKILGPNPDNITTWGFESVYISDNPNSSNDDLSTINLDYVLEQSDNNKEFQIPIKVEVEVSNSTEVCVNETLPRMDVVVEENKKSHICPYCGMTVSREKALISHINMHTIEWTHECEYCAQKFPDENSKQEHQSSCGENKNKTCETKKLDKPKSKASKHACPECNKNFTTKQKMFRHLWVHRKKSFTCEICAVSFKVQNDLDKHRLTEHPVDSAYVCNECGKSFASRQGLWEHGRLHGGNTGIYTCSQCSKTFTSRQGYLIHHRTHTNERPYGCRFCMKAFRDGGTLRKHERIHTGCRPYVCPICSHDFNQKVVLREHVRWVHVANKSEENGGFLCELCKTVISDKEELCAHIVKHSDLISIQAKNSERSFSNSKAVSDFMKNVGKQKRCAASNISLQRIKMETFEDQFDLNSTESINLECDMCGDKFSSQKDLTTHVQIHI